MKKSSIIFCLLIAICIFTVPAQAQVKSLNKVAKKAAGNLKDAAKDVADETSTSAKETAAEMKSSATEAANDAAANAKEAAFDKTANKVSDKIVKWLDANNKNASDSYTQRLNTLIGNKYISVDGLYLNYKVYQNSEANIIACADGSIRIYSGMMDLLSDDQLLGIIAVQIGHIKNKDARNSLLKVASIDNADKAAAAQLEKLLTLSGEKLGTIANELIQIPYTEKQNLAADQYAVNLLKNNGNNVDGLVSALNVFSNIEDNNLEGNVAEKYIKVNGNNEKRASTLK